MWCEDTAQWLEGQRAFSNDISKKAAGPAHGKDWRWVTGVPGYAVLDTLPADCYLEGNTGPQEPLLLAQGQLQEIH